MNDARGKAVLARNLDALMRHQWGKINKTRLATEAKLGQGTYDRINDGTSIGLDVLEKLAATFKVQAWQLIAAEIDPRSPPEIGAPNWPFPDIDPERWDKLTLRQRIEVQGAVRKMLQEFEAGSGNGLKNGTEHR